MKYPFQRRSLRLDQELKAIRKSHNTDIPYGVYSAILVVVLLAIALTAYLIHYIRKGCIKKIMGRVGTDNIEELPMIYDEIDRDLNEGMQIGKIYMGKTWVYAHTSIIGGRI